MVTPLDRTINIYFDPLKTFIVALNELLGTEEKKNHIAARRKDVCRNNSVAVLRNESSANSRQFALERFYCLHRRRGREGLTFFISSIYIRPLLRLAVFRFFGEGFSSNSCAADVGGGGGVYARVYNSLRERVFVFRRRGIYVAVMGNRGAC